MIDQVEQPPTLQKILDKHAAVFDGNLGCMKDVEVTPSEDRGQAQIFEAS